MQHFVFYLILATCRSTSRISVLFNFFKTIFQADTRVRLNFLHPSVILAMGHLLNSVSPFFNMEKYLLQKSHLYGYHCCGRYWTITCSGLVEELKIRFGIFLFELCR